MRKFGPIILGWVMRVMAEISDEIRTPAYKPWSSLPPRSRFLNCP